MRVFPLAPIKRAIILFLLPIIGVAEVQNQKMEGGVLYFDDKFEGPRPGLILLPDTRGMTPFIEDKARELAELGYVTMASKWSANTARARSALDELAQVERVQSKQLAVIGIGMGGSTALELARQRAPIKAVFIFYGDLTSKKPARNFLEAKVVVFQGDDDPFISETQIIAFQQEMQKSQADWQIFTYGNTGHNFLDPAYAKSYNSFSAERSWKQLLHILSELF